MITVILSSTNAHMHVSSFWHLEPNKQSKAKGKGSDEHQPPTTEMRCARNR
jgi:hypothetical protein